MSTGKTEADRVMGRCLEMSGRLSRKLCREGRDATVVNGWFRPDTDPATWHPLWRELRRRFKNDDRGFIHYWVECEGRILDPSASQFGYPSAIETSVGDPRYRAS